MLRFLFVLNDYLIDPLGIAYLSASLKKAGYETDIIKTEKENLWSKIENYSPDVLAFSTTTGWHKYYIKLAEDIKKKYPSLITLFGGAHPTFFPEMVEQQGVDAVCRGEGERAVVAFANAVSAGYWTDFPIPNIWTKTHRSTSFFPLEPVDSLPLPDRDLIYKYPENKQNPIKNIMCSRGCRFSCAYCYNNTMRRLYPDWTVRRRDPHLVVQEAVELKRKYPVELVFFQDDIFVSQLDWLDRFVKLWNAEVRLPFHAQLRYDITNRETVRLLKQGGCQSVTFAVESANSKLCRQMLHRPSNPGRLKRVIQWCQDCGIKVRLECMVGLPTEVIEDSFGTLRLVTECRPDMSWCSIYQPYPRTELGDQAIAAGLFDGDVDKFAQDFFSTSLLKRGDKHLFENLQKFFSFGVDHPRTHSALRTLIQLPPNFLFKKFYSVYKKHKYKKLYSSA